MSRFLSICAVCVICGCHHPLTIAPAAVHARAIAYDGSTQNAGILSYDSAGLVVSADWIRRYDALLKDFGNKLPTDNRVPPGDRTGVVAQGANFHVTWEVQNRFADLKYFERNAAP